MDILPTQRRHPPRTLRKLIGGVEYVYDQRLDLLAAGSPVLKPDYDRTQVDHPVDLCIELTTQCNFTCQNCFSKSVQGLPGRHMDIAGAERAVRDAMPNILRVCITGGEPLLHPHVEQVLDWPSRYPGCGFVLSTNATGSVELLQRMQEHPWLVAVSLHGPREPHNRYTSSDLFDRVTNAILQLARTNIVHLYCVLNDCLSEQDIDWLFRFRDHARVEFLRFVAPRDHGRFRPLTRLGLIEAVRERLDGHSGLKINSSLTEFLSVDFEQRRTS